MNNYKKTQYQIAIVFGLISLIIAFANECCAQSKVTEYQCEYTGGPGSLLKLQQQIILSDSTVTMIVDNQKAVYTIKKVANQVTYITDGVADYSIQITDNVGKVKGFNYDALITYGRVNVYGMSSPCYCKKKD